MSIFYNINKQSRQQNRLAEEPEIIFALNKNKNLLVVSHWIAVKVVLAHYSSTPLIKSAGNSRSFKWGIFLFVKTGRGCFSSAIAASQTY